MNMKDIYNEYVEDCKGKPVSYQEWLHSEFAGLIDEGLSDYEKCLIYNEMAQDKHYLMWDNIENISNIFGDDFLHVYSLIDHDKFNIYDDVIIEEGCLIVSYTYADFVNKYWDIVTTVEYIDKKGVENLINSEIIIDNV